MTLFTLYDSATIVIFITVTITQNNDHVNYAIKINKQHINIMSHFYKSTIMSINYHRVNATSKMKFKKHIFILIVTF